MTTDQHEDKDEDLSITFLLAPVLILFWDDVICMCVCVYECKEFGVWSMES